MFYILNNNVLLANMTPSRPRWPVSMDTNQVFLQTQMHFLSRYGSVCFSPDPGIEPETSGSGVAYADRWTGGLQHIRYGYLSMSSKNTALDGY